MIHVPYDVNKETQNMPRVYSLACHGSGKDMRFCMTISKEADRLVAEFAREVFERHERKDKVIYSLPLRLLREKGVAQRMSRALQEMFLLLIAFQCEEPLPGNQLFWIDYWFYSEDIGGCPMHLWVMPAMARVVAGANESFWRMATLRVMEIYRFLDHKDGLKTYRSVGPLDDYYELRRGKLLVSTSLNCNVSPRTEHLGNDPFTMGYYLLSNNTDSCGNQIRLLLGLASLETLAWPACR